MSPKKHISMKKSERRNRKQMLTKPDSISPEEWNLPAGFRADGSIASLAEVIAPKVPTLNLMSLSSTSKTDLVIERIKRQKNYPIISFLGINDIDQKAAIAEVQKQTQIGKIIEESEQNAIQIMIERAKKELHK